MPDELDDYRKHLLAAEQKAQEEFDKAIIALSGGGLGVSFTFVEKFIKPGPPIDLPLLYYVWISWAASILFIFLSYFCSIRALRCAIKQSYTGATYKERPGRRWGIATEVMNIVGAALFIAGLFLLILFVGRNLSEHL